MSEVTADQITGVSSAGILKTKEEQQQVVVEPRFKYERLLEEVSQALEKDSATCVAVHDKFIVIGFSSGRVGFFDHLGYEHLKRKTRNHRCSVSHIAIDRLGNYAISCANDKQVHIQGFGSADYNQTIEVYPAVRCAALSEDFSKHKSGHRFVTAGQTLVLHEQSFFGKQKTVLYHGLERDGLITTCSWQNSLIAFTNDAGTFIYDCDLKRLISKIQPFQKTGIKASHFPARHVWIDPVTLMITHGGTLWICHVTGQPKDIAALSPKKVNIIHQFTVPDFYIAGASFTKPEPALVCNQKWDEIVLFGFAAGDRVDTSECDSRGFDETRSIFSDVSVFSNLNISQEGYPVNAQFLLLKVEDTTHYTITSEDVIEMKNVDIRLLKRFSLCSLPEDAIYFLVGTREVIEARPCSIEDRVKWFLDNELFEEALRCALKEPDALTDTSVAEIGRKLVHDLIGKDQFFTAASYLNEVCGRCKQEWEYYCGVFDKQKEILKLVPYIPTSVPQLEPECYESILTAALYARTNLFRKLIHEWNPDIYRTASIIDKIIKRMSDDQAESSETSFIKEDLVNLYQSLAHLLAYVRNFQRALDIYLLLKDKAIFGVINRYNLFHLVKDRIVDLMQIDEDLARTTLIENADSIPVQQVVTQLNKHPKLQMLYLNKLHARGEDNMYSDLMIRLFAEYDRKMLLPFLKKCENYKLDQALDVCKRKNYVEEMVYLLGRSGNRLEALDVIMNKMSQIDAAISFCTEHEDDIELWNRLVDLSMQNPQHVGKLLSTAGTFIDPLIVIKKIPTDVEIPDLQKALLKILRDYELQINLLRDGNKVGLDDLLELFDKRVKTGLACTFVDVDQQCCACSEPILAETSDSKTDREVVLLGCGHFLHQACMDVDTSKQNTFACPSCFSSCCLDDKPLSSRCSPTKTTMPQSISQANLNPFFDDAD